MDAGGEFHAERLDEVAGYYEALRRVREDAEGGLEVDGGGGDGGGEGGGLTREEYLARVVGREVRRIMGASAR